MLQHLDDLRTDAVIGIEIGTDDADRKRRRLAGQRLADSLGQYRIDFHQLIRIVVEHVANGRVDFGGAGAALRVDLNFELALVRRVGVLPILGAADLLGNALDPGIAIKPREIFSPIRLVSPSDIPGRSDAWAIR